MQPWCKPVMILASHALPREIARSFEIDHDPLDGPFCNSHHHRNVSNADFGPQRDAREDMGVIAQEFPVESHFRKPFLWNMN